MTDAPRPMAHWNAQLPDVDRIGGNIYDEGRTIICNSGPQITYAPPPDVQVCGVVFSDLEAVYPPLDACIPDSYIEIIDCIAIHRAPFRYVSDLDAYVDCLNEQGARVPVGEDGYRGGGSGRVGTHGIDGAFCWQVRSQGEALGWFFGALAGIVGAAVLGLVGVLNRGFFGWGKGRGRLKGDGGKRRNAGKDERKRKRRRRDAKKTVTFEDEAGHDGSECDEGSGSSSTSSEDGNRGKGLEERSGSEDLDKVDLLRLDHSSEEEEPQETSQAKGGIMEEEELSG